MMNEKISEIEVQVAGRYCDLYERDYNELNHMQLCEIDIVTIIDYISEETRRGNHCVLLEDRESIFWLLDTVVKRLGDDMDKELLKSLESAKRAIFTLSFNELYELLQYQILEVIEPRT